MPVALFPVAERYQNSLLSSVLRGSFCFELISVGPTSLRINASFGKALSADNLVLIFLSDLVLVLADVQEKTST